MKNIIIMTTVIFLSLFSVMSVIECTEHTFRSINPKYYLVAEAYKLAKNLFIQGRTNYNWLKSTSLEAIDNFLDLVSIMNEQMAKELRSAIIKFYKIKSFSDFTSYVVSMEEITNITEHCLKDPIEKLDHIRNHFHHVIHNFEDVRNFNPVEKCRNDLPDEVAAAHCILHQAVLFNETMQDSLVSIVKIKTRQHAQDMNNSLYNVQQCLNNFVPKFFDQLLIDAYTNNCGYLKVVNASISDLIKDKWKVNQIRFPAKWGPLVRLLREKSNFPHTLLQEPLFLTMLDSNLTSNSVINKLLTNIVS